MTDPALCQCGCGQRNGNPSRFTLVRSMWTSGNRTRPSLVTWRVLKTCQAEFTAELVHIRAVEQLARAGAERGWLWKLCHAAQFYDLQHRIYVRRKGDRQAAQIARHCLALLLLPRWLSMRLKLPQGSDAGISIRFAGKLDRPSVGRV